MMGRPYKIRSPSKTRRPYNVGSPQTAGSTGMMGRPYGIRSPSRTRRSYNVGSPQKAVYELRDNALPCGVGLDVLVRGQSMKTRTH